MAEALRRGERFLLTTHVNSDGDGLGSELALGRHLSAIGKDVTIINPTVTQQRYAFLYEDGEVLHYDPSLQSRIEAADVVIVLDINRWDRLGEMTDVVRRAGGKKICIDHHPDPETFGDLDVIVPKVSATGVLVYDLLRSMGAEISDRIAGPLYVAVLTDTGGFRFDNTVDRVFDVAAELVRAGARPDDLYRRVYETNSPERMQLLGETLSDLTYEFDGALVYFSITDDMFRRCNVGRDEADGFTDVVRSARGSKVVLAFIEREDGGSKVSLRSKGSVLNVSEIAGMFGGGGHVNASGISNSRPLPLLRDDVLAAVRGRLNDRRDRKPASGGETDSA